MATQIESESKREGRKNRGARGVRRCRGREESRHGEGVSEPSQLHLFLRTLYHARESFPILEVGQKYLLLVYPEFENGSF